MVALSADHGVAPLPEEGATKGFEGGRASDRAIADAVEAVLDARWGGGGHVADTVEGDLALIPGDYDRLREDADAMKQVLAVIRGVPGVERVFRSDELAKQLPTQEPIEQAAELSYYPGRSGDLVVVLKPYWIYSEPSRSGAPGLGTTHGSPYDYDQRVPVILYGWGVRHGEFAQAAAPMDIAATLAQICGVHMPGSDGRVLKEALRK